MTTIELIELIRQQKEIAERELIKENKETIFLNHFHKSNKFDTLEGMSEIDSVDLILAYIMYNLSNDNSHEMYEYIEEKVKTLRNYINNSNYTDIEMTFKLLDRLKSDGSLENIKELFQDPNKYRSKVLLKKIPIDGMMSNNSLETLLNYNNESNRAVGNLIILYAELDTILINAFALAADLKKLKENFEKLYIASGFLNMTVAQKKEIISQFKSGVDTSIVTAIFDKMEKRYKKISLEEKNRIKTAKNNFQAYSELEKKLLRSSNQEEIKGIGKIIAKISSEEIRMEVLKFIYKHNQPLHEKIKMEYEELAKNDLIHYQTLLKEYDLESITVETIMNNSVEDIKMMLKKLRQLNITDAQVIESILQSTNKLTFNKIIDYVDNGIITPELLVTHKEIFNSESTQYNNFIINIKLFKELGFNPNNLRNSQEVFVQAPTIVGKNIEFLKQYELSRHMNKNVDYAFLGSPNLITTLDNMLELGLEKFLEEDLSILNHYENIDRLRILKELNIPIETKEELIEALTTTKFLVSDKKIPSYLSMVTTQTISKATPEDFGNIKDDMQILKQYEKTSRVYEINGVLISKNRVKRNYSSYDETTAGQNRLLYSILNDSNFTTNEYKTLQQTFKQTLTR